MSNAVEAGKAFLRFVLDDKSLKKDLGGISAKLRKIGVLGAKATAPLIAGFTGAVAAAVNVGDAIGDMATRTGISAEALSELRYAASQSGTQLSSIERGVRAMQKNLVAAAQGTGTFRNTLSTLGLTLQQLETLAPDQQFQAIASAVAAVEDPTVRAALAQKAFGKSGADLLPLLAGGADGLAELRQKAHDLGVTMTDESVAATQQLDDALQTAKEQFLALAVQIGVAVAGPLTDFLQWSQHVVAATIKFVTEHKNAVLVLAAVATTVAAVSAGLVTLSVVASGATLAMEGAAYAAAAFGAIIAFISAHPIIAIMTLLAAGVLAVARYFGLASDEAENFGKKLDGLKSDVKVGAGPELAKIRQQTEATIAAKAAAEQAQKAAKEQERAVREAAKAQERKAREQHRQFEQQQKEALRRGEMEVMAALRYASSQRVDSSPHLATTGGRENSMADIAANTAATVRELMGLRHDVSGGGFFAGGY
jgi:hypothetical protein